MTLIEVVVAFTVLSIAMVPLSYLFMTSVILAGQSTNEQTALSIAEQWVETLSNVTPPVNGNGEVIVNTDAPPVGPAAGSTTTTAAYTVPSSLATPTTIAVAATSTFALATATYPQSASVTTSAGQDTVTYSGQTVNGSSQITALTGVTGWSQQETIANGAVVTQPTAVVPTETKGNTTYSLLAEYEWTTLEGASNGAQPNLCVAGTPQLLKARVTVSWGPNVDTNNVQDSVVLDYPPAGIQTLGFIALQVNGDTTAVDSQGNPWTTRVQAPPVTVTQTSGSPTQKTLTIYPDQNGCAFAQVEPGTYTVTVNNATPGHPFSNDTYGSFGSIPFVENALGNVSANELAQPTTYSGTATVAIGAVSRLATSFDQGSNVSLAYPSSSSTEDGVVCPGVGVLTCISTGETGTGSGVTGTGVLTVFNQATNQWSAATLPSGVTRITSVACATTGAVTNRCIAVGYGSSGEVILSSPISSASFTTDTPLPGGVASLSQVVCPSSTQCEAIGTSTSGAAAVLSGSISAGQDTWTADAITGSGTIAGLSNLTCPSSAGGCVATGTSTLPNAGTPVIVSGGYGLGWTAVSPNPASVTLTSVTALACPSTATSTFCLLTGTTATGPETVAGTATAGLGVAAPSWTWNADAFPAGTTVTSLNGLTCPSSTKCLLIGRTASAPLVMWGATTPSTSVTFTTDASLPAAVTSLTQLACPSSTSCVIIGATASGPAIVSGTTIAEPTGADTWSSATVPTPATGYALTQLSAVTCWSSPACAITAIGLNPSSQPVAFLLASSGGVTSWSSLSLPMGNPALYLGAVGCVSTGTTYCSAVGAGASGAVELVSSAGPTGAWADETASGLSGLTATGIPVEIDNPNLRPSTYQTVITPGWTTAPSNPLPPLYPFTSGYSMFAGDCQSESNPGLNVVQAATVPGQASSATVPLGLLSIQVLHSTAPSIGLPYAATLSLTATTSGCGADAYPLQSAGVDGLSRTEVPYGSYTLTIITVGGTTTVPNVTVGGSSVTVGASTYVLPIPVPEKVA
jgi:Tfp pilus assembly protein PilV